MADRPMMFSASMIRALLDGRKTQTRRILSADLQGIPYLHPSYGDQMVSRYEDGKLVEHSHTPGRPHPEMVLPYVRFAPGDRLWVRETHQFAMSADGPCVLLRGTGSRWSPEWTGPDEGAGPSYDYDRCPGDYSHWAADVESADGPWRPAIHMPRWASRLTLTVTDVRVQRLLDISEDDAKAEGVRLMRDGSGVFVGREGPGRFVTPWMKASEAFFDIWNTIHGHNADRQNPWVVALSFEVRRANIDALPADALDIAGAA